MYQKGYMPSIGILKKNENNFKGSKSLKQKDKKLRE